MARVQPLEDLEFKISPLPDLPTLEELWRSFDKTGDHSFFLTWTWIGSWIRTQNSTHDMQLLRANLKGETIGLAVLTVKTCKYRHFFSARRAWLNASGDPIADRIAIEYNGFAYISSSLEAVEKSLANWVLKNPAKIDELNLPGILPSECEYGGSGFLVKTERQQGFRVPLNSIDEPNELDSLFSRNTRQQLRRSIRSAEKLGSLSIQAAANKEEALALFNEMKIFHIKSWSGQNGGAFSNPAFEPFCREMIKDSASSQSLDLLKISAGTHILGYLFNVNRGGISYNYQSGFNDALSSLRPGYVCHALAINYYHSKKYAYYDFLAKPNQLKVSLGIEPYEIIWRSVRRSSLIFVFEDFCRRLFLKYLVRP